MISNRTTVKRIAHINEKPDKTAGKKPKHIKIETTNKPKGKRRPCITLHPDKNKDVYQVKCINQLYNTDSGVNSDVLFITSPSYVNQCIQHPRLGNRALLVDKLITAYGLLQYMKVEANTEATIQDLLLFHDKDYVDVLSSVEESDCLSDSYQDDEEEVPSRKLDFNEYGIEGDCPPFPSLSSYVYNVAGASIHAAEALVKGHVTRAINWGGGWHHAEKDKASGFCFVNDIVVSILTLRKRYDRILYIDIDLHHGDGVEGAFYNSPHVLTLSFHKQAAGFFPGTGKLSDIGLRAGKYYSVNIPLPDGCKDETYVRMFRAITTEVLDVFHPQAVVMQCGVDGLQSDPNGQFNLTTRGYGACVSHVLSWQLPSLFLGGGGYNLCDTARCWAYLTSLIVGVDIGENIPDHEGMEHYGPLFMLHTLPGNRVEGKMGNGGEEAVIGCVRERMEFVKEEIDDR